MAGVGSSLRSCELGLVLVSGPVWLKVLCGWGWFLVSGFIVWLGTVFSVLEMAGFKEAIIIYCRLCDFVVKIY